MYLDRTSNYNKEHCWQYDIRLNNLKDDLNTLIENGYVGEYENLRVSDFEFKVLTTDEEKKEAISFIKKHEWLGDISLYTSHWFGCYLKGYDILSGVLLMNNPNSFMKIGNLNTKKIERLISRGACISWSPKNLGSWLVMTSIKWMVKNTQYRIFTCYSDTSAKELGTIYQACNFYYLGDKFGADKKYINPYNGNIISDRMFRMRSMYKKYAIDLNIPWDKSWNKDSKMLWENMPKEIEDEIRNYGKELQQKSKYISIPKKHKYIYILGENKKETRILKNEFLKNISIKDYPKER